VQDFIKKYPMQSLETTSSRPTPKSFETET